MTSTPQHVSRPVGRATLLLVLAVLAGVLAMHALAPGAGPAPHTTTGTGHGPAATATAPGVPAVPATALGTPAAAPGTPVTVPGTPAVVHAVAFAEHAGHGCAHATDGSGPDGHLSHADATCAASGISTTYVPPALSPAVFGHGVGPWTYAAALADGTRSGRAPPDLAQLQLLRI